MGEIAIRRASGRDALLVRDVRLRALGTDPASFGSSLEREQAYSDQRWQEWVTGGDPRTRDLATLLAFDGDMPVGIATSRRDADRDDVFHVFAMWVAPEARRRGVARALLGEAEEWARRHGAASVELGVTGTALAAQALYMGAGYVRDGSQEPLAHLPGVVEFGLRKPLA